MLLLIALNQARRFPVIWLILRLDHKLDSKVKLSLGPFLRSYFLGVILNILKVVAYCTIAIILKWNTMKRSVLNKLISNFNKESVWEKKYVIPAPIHVTNVVAQRACGEISICLVSLLWAKYTLHSWKMRTGYACFDASGESIFAPRCKKTLRHRKGCVYSQDTPPLCKWLLV